MNFRAEIREIFSNGLWKQNSSLVQTLGLCPLLAVTTNIVNGAMLSLATILVAGLASFSVSGLRRLIPHEIRIPIFIMIAATLVTLIDQCMASFFSDIHNVLGIFIPLIITNCILMGRIEAFALGNKPWPAFLDGIGNGAGYGLILLIVSFSRELLGSGTLFGYQVVPEALYQAGYENNGLMILPPMALILVACIIWVHRALNKDLQESKE